MPTGYTSFIEDGKVKTAKQFLHLCLRAFGVTMMIREDSLEVKDDYTEDLLKAFRGERSYHKKKINEAQKRMDAILALTDEELYQKYIKSTKDDIASYTKFKKEEEKDNTAYNRIAEDIKKWDCDPKFEEIKRFALNQINLSVHNSDYWEEKLQECKVPTREEFQKEKESYLSSMIKDVQWDINFHTEELEKVKARQVDCMAFYKQFMNELNKLQ